MNLGWNRAFVALCVSFVDSFMSSALLLASDPDELLKAFTNERQAAQQVNEEKVPSDKCQRVC